MALAPKPKEEPRKGEPKEAGAAGGAPAEGRPPAAESSGWVEMELVTVSRDGERLARKIRDLTLTFALNQAAGHILMDIFEAVKDEVLHELPRPRIRAAIYGAKAGDRFTVEVKGNSFTRVYHIPKEKAVYYFGGFDIKGFYVYVRIEAVYVPGIRTTFYEVIADSNTVKAVGEDLHKMLNE